MSAPPATMTLQVGDLTINCVCPPGTRRLAKDLTMVASKEKGVTWLHRPCKPFSAKANLLQPTEDAAAFPLPGGSDQDNIGEGAVVKHGGNDPAASLAALLGPAPTAGQLTKVKNFTEKFICDGCEAAPKGLKDYFTCKNCLSWQHVKCMIFGEKGDLGRPVCNHCYMDFLAHHEEIDRWQRRRLMEAVQEGIMFLIDPETSHEVWRREWCKKFLRRFFAANKGLFVQFVTARRHAQRIAREQGIYDPAFFPQGLYPAALPFTPPPKEEDEDAGAELDVISLVSSDNIIVRKPRSKIATKTVPPVIKKRVRKKSPERPDGKRRSHRKGGGLIDPSKPKAKPKAKAKGRARKKQRVESPPSEPESEAEEEERGRSPVRVRKNRGKSQLTAGAGAARKSVRMSEVMKKPTYRPDSEDDQDDNEDDDEYELKTGEPTINDMEPEVEERSPTPVRKRKNRGKSQLVAGVGAARKSVKMSEAMKKPAYRADSENDEDDDEDEEEDENEDNDDEYELKTPSRYTNVMDSGDDVVGALLSEFASNEPPLRHAFGAGPPPEDEFNCDCAPHTFASGPNFVCSSCRAHQHKPCAKPGQEGKSSPWCNMCYYPKPVPSTSVPGANLQTPQKTAPELSAAGPGNGEQPLDQAMLDEILHLCSTVLWKEYVSLPSPDDDEDNITATPQKPLSDWLEECELRMINMITAAGPEQTRSYLESALDAVPRDTDAIVESLYELATWVVRKGVWRGKRAELGLLAEIVGMVDKGHYWQGSGV